MVDRKAGTILFVDDEPLSLKYFKASVGKYASVKTASSPDAALAILETEGEEISVVVSDERMPRESGVSFLSEVRKSRPSTIRVLTSAYADIDNLQQAINDAAVFRFIPKPWDLDELCSVMQDALRAERMTSSNPTAASSSRQDAKDASLALLAILTGGFDAPLKSLSAEAHELVRLSGQGTLNASQTASSYIGSWSSRLKLSKIGSASAQVQKDVEHCRSLASSINRLARDLLEPTPDLPASMAETLQEVIKQNTHGRAEGLLLDTARDFTYRMPREIMKFILANLLRGGRPPQARHYQSEPSGEIALFAGAAHNEVRLTIITDGRGSLENNQAWRSIRSALWAFGAELLISHQEDSGRTTLTLHLPKTA